MHSFPLLSHSFHLSYMHVIGILLDFSTICFVFVLFLVHYPLHLYRIVLYCFLDHLVFLESYNICKCLTLTLPCYFYFPIFMYLVVTCKLFCFVATASHRFSSLHFILYLFCDRNKCWAFNIRLGSLTTINCISIVSSASSWYCIVSSVSNRILNIVSSVSSCSVLCGK